MMKKQYKIGTRGSLLALTQCNQIKAHLEKITGDEFELEIIKTQGDQITDKPLWQLEGNNFFTKELDDALISDKVDLVVHSYKDLGSLRPDGIILAAVTKRSFAHDILLIKQSTIEQIKNKNQFIVGTSSPRRSVNLTHHLAKILPTENEITIVPKMLRGNVNTRIEKLRNGDYDAIVLALAGIERLALTPESCIQLTKLLDGITFMVLPQSLFPSSASQGALGIECKINRNDDGELLEKLKKLEDANTKEEVARERQAFNNYGGGCHLAVGINVKKLNHLFVHIHRGELNGHSIEKISIEGRELPVLNSKGFFFNGHHKEDELIDKKPLEVIVKKNLNLYVTSKFCIHALYKENQASTIWSAGIKTMENLAKEGFWVNGSADSFGDAEIIKLKSSKALSLMSDLSTPFGVLTNNESTSEIGETIPCYERVVNPNYSDEFKNKINQTEIFFWTSYNQYKTYLEFFPNIKNKIHTCGLGKTYDQFRKNQTEVLPFSNMDELKKWMKQ
jgi:hydroxymethylbilane synthase